MRVCGLLGLLVGSLAGLGEACGGSSSSSAPDSGAPPPDGGGDGSVAVDSGGDSSAAVDSSAAIDSSADAGADSQGDSGPVNAEGGGGPYPCFDSGACDPATQYCYLDTMNGAFIPSCVPLPFGCTAPSCACFDAGPASGCTCTDAPDGGLLVTCTSG
jgi:hypothetical protein